MTRVLLPRQVANFRDLGGLRAGASTVLRSHRLLRSSVLAHLPRSTVDELTDLLGPCVYFDLRTDEELDRDGGAERLVAAGWCWQRIPIRDQPPGAERVDPLVRYRTAMPRYRAAADTIAATLVGQPRPGVLGCSLGKDRTGMVTAVLLHRLGVFADEIAADFELSNTSLAAQRHLLPSRWRDGEGEITPVSAEPCLATLAAPDSASASDIAKLRADLLVADTVDHRSQPCEPR